MIPSSLISAIASELKDAPETAAITITKNSHGYKVERYDTTPPAESVSRSIEYLKECFGVERLQRICKKPDISLNASEIESNTLILTKTVMRNILIGVGDVQKADYDEVAQLPPTERHQRLFPFASSMKSLTDALLGAAPKISDFFIDRASSSGKGIKGLIERIFLSLNLQLNLNRNQDNLQKNDYIIAETITSQLADREWQEKSLIQLGTATQPKYYYVDKVLIKGGAYISILKDVDGTEPPKIICRGTAARPSSTDAINSLLNDLLIEIGMKGVKAVWPELVEYLNANEIKSVELYGKSMGGAQALALSVLLEGVLNVHVDCLTTYCSVQAGYAVEIFNREILGKRTEQDPFQIVVLRNGGKENETDNVPIVGGLHLGADAPQNKCNVSVVYLQQGQEGEQVDVLPLEMGIFSRIFRFFKSFPGPHCRQSTLDNFNFKKLEPAEAQQHLRVGLIFEKCRLFLAYAIHLLTFTLFNGQFFSEFYSEQKAMASSKVTSGISPVEFVSPT
ncbi:MAG: hypothetical protein WC222_09475 [Parachlamydiales bacterium]|jgi:hypothetical protein